MLNLTWKVLKTVLLIFIPILTSSWACDLLSSSSDLSFLAGLLLMSLTASYIIYWVIKIYPKIKEKL